MPTKDDLTKEVADLKEQLALAQASEGALIDFMGEPLEEGELYKFDEGALVSYGGDPDDALFGGPPVRNRVVAMVGVDAWNVAALLAADEGGEGVGVEDVEVEVPVDTPADEPAQRFETVIVKALNLTEPSGTDAVLHVLLRNVTSDDGETSALTSRVTLLEADLQAAKISRDEHKARADLAEKRLHETGTLHGSIANLPSVT